MKKLVKVEEVEGEGLLGLLNKTVVVYCMNYIYSGTLAGVNDEDILLEDAKIVYQTGALNADEFYRAEDNSAPLYIRLSAVESYSEYVG